MNYLVARQEWPHEVADLRGTADARHLASALHQTQPCLELIYSVAGLVRQPQVPATVVSGGFTQFGGLSAYCKQQNIDGIVNTTHPFSVTMGQHAEQTCHELGLNYWRFKTSMATTNGRRLALIWHYCRAFKCPFKLPAHVINDRAN